MLLSDRQVEQVELRILESGLKNHQLHLDLVDHVCCSIEELMDSGLSFELAMPNVFQTYSRRHIRKIEYTTTILTTDTMKKRTKIIGIIGLIITIIGSTMKLYHLAGAYMVMVLGVTILGIGFFGSNAIDTIRNIDGKKGKVVQVLGAIGAFMTLTGGMFKILHLPGASVLLMGGPVLLLLYFSFSSYLRTRMIE
jgi:hypothetical protein